MKFSQSITPALSAQSDRTSLLARLGKKKGETKMGHDLTSQCNYTPIYNSSEPLSSMSHLVVIQLIRDMSI